MFRLTFVGENGYELHLAPSDATAVMDAVLEAKPDIVFAGAEVSRSVEKQLFLIILYQSREHCI